MVDPAFLQHVAGQWANVFQRCRSAPVTVVVLLRPTDRQRLEPFAVRGFECCFSALGSSLVLRDAYQHKKVDYASPAGILISILSRLIHQIVESPAPVTLTDVSILDKLVREEDLSCMFERLVGVLPAGTVLFCVLDGLSYYEAKKRGKDCMDLLTMLARLTRRRPETIHGPMVKLLVTAPLGTYAIHEFFGEEQKLNLDPYYTSHGGFSAKYWDVRMGGAIEN